MNGIVHSNVEAACAKGNKLYMQVNHSHIFFPSNLEVIITSDPTVQWNIHTNTKNYGIFIYYYNVPLGSTMFPVCMSVTHMCNLLEKCALPLPLYAFIFFPKLNELYFILCGCLKQSS